MPSGFITRKTTSVALAPPCHPTLTPPRENMDGAPHSPLPLLRHTSKPRPYVPPKTQASFTSDGTIPTQTALFSKLRGMPLSGVPMISLTTLVAFCSWLSPAKALAQQVSKNRIKVSLFIAMLLFGVMSPIGDLQRLRLPGCNRGGRESGEV